MFSDAHTMYEKKEHWNLVHQLNLFEKVRYTVQNLDIYIEMKIFPSN